VNTTERGMWFVQLLDDLGKAMGLPNGTKDMTVENFGKLIIEGATPASPSSIPSASGRTTAGRT